MKTKLTLRNLFALSLIVAAAAFAEEEPARELADSDREAVAIVVLRDYFTGHPRFSTKARQVAFVQIEPKAGGKAQAASDFIKKHFGTRPIVQDASKSERDSFGNVVDPKTGQHTEIITLGPIRTAGENVVSVHVFVYSECLNATSYQYQLKKVDDRWRVVSAKATGSA